MQKPYDEKIALITGSNKGLGREIAKQLGNLGMTILASARNEQRGRKTVMELQEEGLDVRFLQLDVTDGVSVKKAAEHIDQEFGRLNVLINNAGITVDEERPSEEHPQTEIRPPSAATADQLRQTYEVNVFGVVEVTRAMLPLLHRAPTARVVNMSSNTSSLAFRADLKNPITNLNYFAYGSSKTALNMITLQYANELRGSGILVNAASPGFTATDLNSGIGRQTVEEGAKIAVRLATLSDDGPTGAFLSEDGPVPW